MRFLRWEDVKRVDQLVIEETCWGMESDGKW